jgi:WD40 repeat protein
MIQHLQQHAASVQYFFFRAGNDSKRSMASLIKTLAFQISQRFPAFRSALLELADAGYKLKDFEWRASWKRIFINSLFEMEFHPPLYWVIDGLDEAHSPHHIFDLLADINSSKIPIRVIITSRWSSSLSTGFDRISSKVSISEISIDRDLTDMSIYIKEELRYQNWSSEITDEVVSQILERSNDNFLWVHLILDELKDCNTAEDIKERIHELPPGMDALYIRMEETIASLRRPSDINLAHHLLQWAIYSRHSLPTEELIDVLEPEFGRLLDLAQTTSRLCGHFITIEGGKHIAVIHQTAREYLTTTSTLPFSLRSDTSHAALFKQSMSSFMAKGLRSKLQQVSPKLLQYRSTSWPLHLEASEMIGNGEEQLDLLASFFFQKSVLIWISILASLGELKVLIKASRSLYSFVRKKRKADAAKDPASRRYDDLENLEAWSRDLLKIVGKFGSSLSHCPDSIFTSVAPFCPSGSSIYKYFGTQPSNFVTVKGQSEDWDDCLARVSLGKTHTATLVCCSAKYLALAASSGLVKLWDSTTFRHIITIEHGERISDFCFGEKGDRLATYGYRTTRIWESQTGRLLYSIENSVEMQAMSLKFSQNDSVLLMATDRSCILRAPLLSDGSCAWDISNIQFMTSSESSVHAPSMMTFSPDGSKVAIAYRRFPLSIWSTNPVRLIKQITRPQRQSQVATALPFASRVSWHPSSEEIMGLFMDGYSFRMSLVDDTYQEQPSHPGQVPSNIFCSPDGLVYAISGVGGTIKLFDYRSSTLIYQLNSEGMVNAFCFNHDGQRFCDIRSGYCTIWEPNALMRLAAVGDDVADSQAADDSVKQSHIVSESFVEQIGAITLMSPTPVSASVCLGDEDGAITLFDYDKNETTPVGQTATGMSIEHLAWDHSDDRLCYVEIRGRLTLIQIDEQPSGRQIKRLARFKAQSASGEISQVFFLPGKDAILVAASSSAQIWSLETVKTIVSCSFDSDIPRKWLLHPSSRDLLLSISASSIILHRASDLSEIGVWRVDEGSVVDIQNVAVTDALPAPSIREAFSTFYRNHIIVNYEEVKGPGTVLVITKIFDISNVGTVATAAGGSILPTQIPPEVSQRIEVPLNVLANGKFIFIDHSFWVCSWKLGSVRGIADLEEHFFIPRDWLPVKSQDLMHLKSSGSIICPRKGGVSSIDSLIGSMW